MSKGCLLVVSAPSGAGKTTLLKKILADTPKIGFSVSHTTRAPRQGEESGRDYHFVSQSEFLELREEGAFLEWAEVHGNFYGTSRHAVEEEIEAGNDVLLDIDVQGARQVKEMGKMGELGEMRAVFLFIAPPSARVLEQRLRGRDTDIQEVIALRLENARREMEEAAWYDYLVVNDQLSEAVALLRAIISAERCRRRRRPDGSPLPHLF